MGTTTGSILQGIGQTGNEIGSGEIAAQNQSHQFLMDYLARQAQTRQLNLEQSGQEQTGRIASGYQDIERQRLNQSRWQLMPGFSTIPDPSNPGKSLYRHTFVDPITKQQTYYDADQPPPGSPEYSMNSFKFMRNQAKQNGIDLPINTLLSISGMKVDTPSDVNNKYQTYWQQLTDAAKNDPAAKAALDKNYPGGYVDFFTQTIKGEHPGFSKEDWDKYVIENHLNLQGNGRNDPMDKMYEDTLTHSLTAHQKMFDDSAKTIASMGATGKYFQPEAYAAAVSARDNAAAQLADVRSKMDAFRSRQATPPEAGPTVTPPAFTNPSVGISQAEAQKLGATHKVDVGGVFHYAKADGTDLGVANGN